MKRLTREAQERAASFLYASARPLDRCIYAAHFEGGSPDAVFAELVKFQNSDGGFGHALEPDLRLPDSSVLATTVGLQVLRAFGAAPDHPLVSGAMRYLLQRYDPAMDVWPFIPPNTDDAPHAPWWTYGENVAASWNYFLVNPRVEIVAYLCEYDPPGFPRWVTERLMSAVVNYVAEHLDKIQMFDLLCYNRLLETAALPGDIRRDLKDRLVPLVDASVVKDPAKWGNYGLAPLELVDSPDSPFASLLADVVEQNLDFEIARQHADGSWKPKWSWGGLYPETWLQACRDWTGHLTVRMLTTLRDFGRLD